MTTTAEWRKWNAMQTKPITNADRIRAMTDEELAECFAEKACPTSISKKGHCVIPDDCEQCWLDWLRQEAQT